MNILITGSNGFIGSYFVNKYANLYNIRRFSFLKDDLNVLNMSGINTVIHLSALVHQMSGADSREYEKINVKQTVDLAKKAKKNGVQHFIFMSTVKVYGEEIDTFYKEDSKCNPLDEYGKSKLLAENEISKLEEDNFKISIIRTPIVYGKGVKANIKLLVNLVNKINILPLGGITNKRSMVYIGNLCHLIHILIEKKKSGIFLASDDKPLSTTQFIKLIAKSLDKKVYIIRIPFLEILIKLLKPSFYKRLFQSLEINNSTTKETLNLQNPYSIDEGIANMINGEKF